MATTSINIQDLNVGLCRVVINPDAVAPDVPTIIELTTDGVKVNVKQNLKPINLNETGSAPVDYVTDGVEATFEIPVAVFGLDLIKTAFPTATKTVDGTTPTKEKVTLGAQAGVSMRQFGKKIRVEPHNGGPEKHMTLLVAIPETDLNQEFKTDTARPLNIVFRGLPDFTKDKYPTVEFGDGTVL